MGTVVLVLPGSPSVPFGPAVSSRSSTSEPVRDGGAVDLTEEETVRDRGAIEVTSRGGGGRVMGTVVLVLPGSPSVPFGPAVSSRSSTSEPVRDGGAVDLTEEETVRDRGAIEVTSRGGGGRVLSTIVLVLPGSPSVPFGPAVSSRSSTSEPESLTIYV